MIEDCFNRLIELKIDPIITFKVLNLGQQTMSVVRLFFGLVDPVEILGEIIKELNPEAGQLYSGGVNKTGAVLKAGANVISQSNATSVMAHVIATLVPVFYQTPRLSDPKVNQTRFALDSPLGRQHTWAWAPPFYPWASIPQVCAVPDDGVCDSAATSRGKQSVSASVSVSVSSARERPEP